MVINMKKITFILAVIAIMFTSFSAFAFSVGNGWNNVNVYYSNNGPGMAGMYKLNNGYRKLRFYNNTKDNINCKGQNVDGFWVVTGVIGPNRYTDIGIGNAPGNWTCWYI